MKTWLITGCSSGFGKELAKHALAQGDAVVATARNTDSLNDLTGEVLKLKLDVTSGESVKKAVAEAKAWKKIDVLVNNAGFGGIASVEETKSDTWMNMFGVNVFGIVNMLKAVLPIMREQKSGHILNISSVAGLTAMPGLGPYCATKFAVEGLSEALAQEVAPLGIKVTIIEPGAFKTSFMGNVVEDDISEDYKGVLKPMIDMLRSMESNAPGDPAKAAKVMYDVVGMEEPPLRLLLGKDAYTWAMQKVDALKEQITAHEELTKSTDF